MLGIYKELHQIFNRKELRVRFIPKNRNICNRYENELPPEDVLSSYLDHQVSTEFETLCQKYGIESSRRTLFPVLVNNSEITPSRHIFGPHQSSLYGMEEWKFHRCIDFLDCLDEDLIPLRTPGVQPQLFALQAFASSRNLPSICIGQSPVANTSGLYHDGDIEWVANAKTPYSDLSDEEITKASEFIKSFRENPELHFRTPSRLPTNEKINMIFRQYNIETILKKGGSQILSDLKRKLNAAASRKFSLDKETSRNTIKEGNYILYTIQNYREERVLGHALPYFDQAWLIEHLSKVLPMSYLLCVKDHPDSLGLQPILSIRSISKHAKLLHHNTSSLEAIKHSSAIVTLNNTVGYESILHGKNVICLGDAFYTGAGYTIDVTDIGELPSALSKATESDGLPDQKVIEFAIALLDGSYPGELSVGQVGDLSESILRYIDENELVAGK